ncbi:MAG: antitoxin VapB family protein [Candidatus Diapherotrites archaeon]
MASKTLTIRKDVYDALIRAKEDDESFSEMFERLLTEKKPDLLKYAGIWKISEKEKKGIEREIKKMRKSADKNFEERLRRILS